MVRLSCLLPVVAAGFALGSRVDNGTVTTLNGIAYYMSGSPVAHLPLSIHAADAADDREFLPLTILESSASPFTPSDLASTVESYIEDDDVFQEAFLEKIYLRTPGSVESLSSLLGASPKLEKSSLLTSANANISSTVPKGPYFASRSTGYLYPAYRLYTDDSLAFLEAAIHDGSGGFLSMPGTTSNAMSKSIAVPSRLYYAPPSPSKPLSGLRLGVKDIYHLRGMATSGGNRAYYAHYGVQNATAPSIQRLVDLGAVVVGKMGTVQFANGDNPTADWVDFHCPFNPRGDGYQRPSGSSTGPAAGVAAYAWLDAAVGSDTGGSMRFPAAVGGIFGNRPSTGAVPMDGAIPLSPVSDTAGVFARSGALWADITQAWYPGMASNYSSLPRKIFYAILNPTVTGSHSSCIVLSLK
jgi:hypothetical protein